MDFEKLVEFGMDKATSVYSDDGSAVQRDTERFYTAIASQDVYTAEDIEKEVRNRMNEAVRRINEQFYAKQVNNG